MLLCLHEEAAVAIAHGYAKVTGKAMVTAVHSNVGLMHASMAMFNAWCDRMPVVVLGATGPVDAVKRRPWIDWIHTARDQGALVREYTKWDDQPASPGAAREALMRGTWTRQHRAAGPGLHQFRRRAAGDEGRRPTADDRRRALHAAGLDRRAGRTGRDRPRRCSRAPSRSLILAGRASRSEDAWNARVGARRGAQCPRRHRS